MHQIRFRLGLRSRPHWATGGAYSALDCRIYLDFRGPTFKGSERGEEAKRGKERKGTKRGREGRQAPPYPFPIRYATGSGEPFAASETLGDLTWLEDFLTSK